MPHSKLHILLVEDNPADARLVQLALEGAGEHGLEITHVERLSKAIDALDTGDFDGALLDMSLPDATGMEAVTAVNDSQPDMPIVVLSGQQDEQVALEAVRSGAQDYLVKGFTDGALIARSVRYAVERKRAEVELRKMRDELEQRVRERTANLTRANQALHEEVLQRLETEAALKQQRDFVGTVLDTVSALVVVLDIEGRITAFNRACELLTGRQADEVRGIPVWQVLGLAEEAGPLQALFESLIARREMGRPEVRCLAADGEIRYIAWTVVLIHAEQGDVDYIICTGTDITEQKHAAELERQRMLELAHTARVGTLGEMATQLAHELNQPLTAIAGFSAASLRLMQMGQWEGEDMREALRSIQRQAERAGEIIRRMRGFVRKAEFKRQILELGELTRDAVRFTEVEARWAATTVTLDAAQDLPLVEGDAILIEQVILNLVRNAIDALKALPEGEPREIRIDLQADSQASEVRISVSDNGPGLTEEEVAQVFDPFYTTKEAGMGMGLAICQTIVQSHGGRLSVRSQPGDGAVFTFTLPVTRKGDSDG